MYDLIHIGYQKCGSTFFQKAVFPSLKQVDLTVASDFVQGLMYYDDPVYQMFSTPTNKTHEPQNSGASGRIRVLSSEIITHRYHAYTRVADRLKHLSPDAKILVIIRNQPSFLRSAYMHRILWGYGCTFERFMNNLSSEEGAMFGINYFTYLSEYKERFENVKVVLFEELFKEETLQDVLSFVGIPKGPLPFDRSKKVNPNYSPFTHKIALTVNKYSGTKGQYFDPMEIRYYNMLRRFGSYLDRAYYKFYPDSKLKISDDCVRYIKAYYAKDNEKLQEWFDNDIRELGYHY
tara:strand:+ start:120 stop:992 length:873 start_codon:yes stop_codon:yes gene_type:complete